MPSSLNELRAAFSSAPRNLLVICALQTFLLFYGFLVGTRGAECDILLPPGGDVQLDCTRCRLTGGFQAQQLFLLSIGLAIIGTGAYGAYYKSKPMCRFYGLVMTVYSFVIGLTAILTGLQAPVLDAAADAVEGNEDCARIGHMMADRTRHEAIMMGLNCLLDGAGAIYAIKSYQYFDYEELHNHHSRSFFSSEL